jgi:hypothetical protein
MKSFNDDIMKFIRERQAEGERKYGKTIERDDMRPSAWANHALEEMADGIQYAARCVQTVERLEVVVGLALNEFSFQIARLPDGEERNRIASVARKLNLALVGQGNKPVQSLPWHEAPEWAQWAAMDKDGSWFWYDMEPSVLGDQWHYAGRTCDIFDAPKHPDWTQSKQRRPQ